MVFTIDSGITKVATPAITLGVGFAAWMYTATRISDKGMPILSAQRFSDALGNIVGPNLANQITGKTTNSVQKFNMLGWANKVTAIGIGIKIVNSIFYKETEKYLDSLPDFIDAAANGLIAGGVIGGLFDPAGYTNIIGGGRADIGSVPFGRGDYGAGPMHVIGG